MPYYPEAVQAHTNGTTGGGPNTLSGLSYDTAGNFGLLVVVWQQSNATASRTYSFSVSGLTLLDEFFYAGNYDFTYDTYSGVSIFTYANLPGGSFDAITMTMTLSSGTLYSTGLLYAEWQPAAGAPQTPGDGMEFVESSTELDPITAVTTDTLTGTGDLIVSVVATCGSNTMTPPILTGTSSALWTAIATVDALSTDNNNAFASVSAQVGGLAGSTATATCPAKSNAGAASIIFGVELGLGSNNLVLCS